MQQKTEYMLSNPYITGKNKTIYNAIKQILPNNKVQGYDVFPHLCKS